MPDMDKAMDDMIAMPDMDKAMDDMIAWREMIATRQPQMLPQVNATIQEALERVSGMFQKYSDLAEGRITHEEFCRIVEQERSQARAEAAEYWRRELGLDDEETCFDVNCRSCYRSFEWDVDEQGEWPPTYFECEDVTGVSCTDEDEDEDSDDSL